MEVDHHETTALPDGRGAEVEPLEGGGAIVWLRRRSRPRPARCGSDLLGHDPGVRVGTGRRERGLRSLELLAVLAMHPEGMTAEQLALALYGERGKAVTIRAQVHRVRLYLGARSVETHPYRLNVPVEADWLEVSRRRGRRAAARGAAVVSGPVAGGFRRPGDRRGACAARGVIATLDPDHWRPGAAHALAGAPVGRRRSRGGSRARRSSSMRRSASGWRRPPRRQRSLVGFRAAPSPYRQRRFTRRRRLGLLRAFAQSTAQAIAIGTTERNPRCSPSGSGHGRRGHSCRGSHLRGAGPVNALTPKVTPYRRTVRRGSNVFRVKLPNRRNSRLRSERRKGQSVS